MSSPVFLLLDEPSMGLAPMMVSQVFDAIRGLHKQGLTVLIVEQKAYLALRMVDRAYVLTNGKITISGTGEELLENKEVKHAYLGQK
jgi:branched-chain amino acid transport system ATP-binding protein